MQAMGRLGVILYDVYVVACSYPAGNRGKDFGFGLFARSCVGSLSAEKCIEAFDFLFQLASTAGRKRRQRFESEPINWVALIERTEEEKYALLVQMHEAEVVTRRIVAEKPPGSKSPRSGDDDEAGGEAKRARGARGGAAKKDKAAAALLAAETAKNTAAAAALLSGPAPAPAPPTKGGGGGKAPAASAEVIAAAIESLSIAEVNNFAVVGDGKKSETASHLFNQGMRACFPEMAYADSPCFFAWMSAKGCSARVGKPACANCARAKELGKAALRPPAELIAAIKAAANESTKALIK